MKKWNEAMEDIRFDGKNQVMQFIDSEENKRRSIFEKLLTILDHEIEIPLPSVVAIGLVFLLVISLQSFSNRDDSYEYTITVVNQWGQYETY